MFGRYGRLYGDPYEGHYNWKYMPNRVVAPAPPPAPKNPTKLLMRQTLRSVNRNR